MNEPDELAKVSAEAKRAVQAAINGVMAAKRVRVDREVDQTRRLTMQEQLRSRTHVDRSNSQTGPER